MMTVVGGRVIAMFTANRLGRPKPDPIPLLEGITLVSSVGVVLLQLAIMVGGQVPASLLGGVMLLAALANIVRMAASATDEKDARIYTTRFAVEIPPERAANCLATLANTAGSMRLVFKFDEL